MTDYHLAGIGGVGMSALAQVLLDAELTLSGSDRLFDSGDMTDCLQRLHRQGVCLFPQNGTAACNARKLVISSAIENDNPEVKKARAIGRPILHRAELLSTLIPENRLIAVAGTSGKSTTTAMLGWILAEAGIDPVVVNGAGVIGWGFDHRMASVRRGQGSYWVCEVDESDRSLLYFSPRHAIITNASADHFNASDTLTLFAEFRKKVSGVLIDGIAAPDFVPSRATGFWEQSFQWEDESYRLPLPGAHNVSNAVQALRMALTLGVQPDQARLALATFPGIERRLQCLWHGDGVMVVDDYAHNPAKLRAAWTSLYASGARIVGLWRPHGYGPLRNRLDDLTESFRAACRPQDRLLLPPVYDAGGSADRRVQSNELADRLRALGVRCELVADWREAEGRMRAEALPGTVLLTLGARDPDLPRLARRLANTLAREAGHTAPHQSRPSSA